MPPSSRRCRPPRPWPCSTSTPRRSASASCAGWPRPAPTRSRHWRASLASIRSASLALSVPLEDGAGFRRYLRAASTPHLAEPVASPAVSAAVPALERCDEEDEAVSCALRFRAALREAFERELAGLFGDLAARVVARELRLAPADLEAIARAVLEHRGEGEPLALRAAPEDGERLRELVREHGLALVFDECMHPGDVMLELRCGALESTLATRLDGVLACRGAA
ncbi:hypothetical protein EPN52_00045 [bacterium]|nr:MAG: hypothetical protein EPN52_00045 [bacterium]